MSDRPTVVCIESMQFQTDIKVLKNAVRDINWHFLRDYDLANAQAAWWPAHMKEQTVYAYEVGPHLEELWERARGVGLSFLDAISKEHRVTAVMAGNWDYWHDEAMRLACETRGIPFLTLLREHAIVPADFEDGRGYEGYKLVPRTDGVAVAGEISRIALNRFVKIPPERIRVTGLPRYDLWYTPQPPLYERPVLLLSYLKGYGAPDHFNELLKTFGELAERHPSVPFVVKAKHYGELPVITKMVRAFSDRVQVTDSTDMPRLMRGARAIIGYNSLAVYEGLFTDAAILVPQWGQAAQPPRSQAPTPTDPQLKGHMDFLRSEEEFRAAIEESIAGRYPVSDRKSRIETFAKYFCYSASEPASFRVRRFVEEFGKR